MLARLPRKIPTLALVASLGCASNPDPRTATFNPSEYVPYNQAGDGVISGQAFLRTHGGEVRYGAGSEVYLNPVTSYSREWWNQAVVDGKLLEPADRLVRAHMRKVVADGEGRFVFGDLPPGEYYVVTSVFWDVPGGAGSTNSSGQVVGRQVRLGVAGRVDLLLDEVYPTPTPLTGVPVTVATQPTPAGQGASGSPLMGGSYPIPAARVSSGTDGHSQTPAPAATTHASAPDSSPPRSKSPPGVGLAHDQQVRQAIGDLRRLGIAQSVQEMALGLLRVEMLRDPSAAPSAEYQLASLYGAYRRSLLPRPDDVIIELYSGGAKFGEYTKDGLLIGPEFAAPR
jgi:hypothetical protein